MTTQQKTDINSTKLCGEARRLENYLLERGLSQAQLVALCKEKGYSVSQSNISKLISGNKRMSIEECKAVCHSLGISADSLLFGKKASNVSEDFFKLTESTIFASRGLLGEYKLFYLTTAMEEGNRVIDGILHLYKTSSHIRAVVKINAAPHVQKIYKGFYWSSNQSPSAYIILRREKPEELSVLSLRYREFPVEPMKGRMALCITTSAGEKKEPIVHRIVLIRESELKGKDQDMVVKSVGIMLSGEKPAERLEIDSDLKLFQMIQGFKGESINE